MKNIFNNLRNKFLIGMITILPIALTIWILLKIFNVMDSILGNTLYKMIGHKIPGLGILLMLLVVILTGSVANHFIGKKVTGSLQNLLLKLPIVKTIYGPLKDIFSNLSNKESNNFKKAVMVTYPKEGTQCLGFITKEGIDVDGQEKTVIFIPTTPNPTSGILVYVGKEEYFELTIPVDDALKSIVSLGAMSPNQFRPSKD